MSNKKNTNKKITTLRLARIIAALTYQLAKLIMPMYGPKGRKGYGKPRLLALYAGKIALKNAPWSEITEIARLVKDDIGLEDIPDESTVRKFVSKLDIKIVNTFIALTLAIAGLKHITIAVDSTGFTLYGPSHYFLRRAKKRESFMKLHVAMDVDSKLILVSIATTDGAHDGKVFREQIVRLLMALKDLLGFDISFVLADAMYDSEENIRLVWDDLRALPLINIARRGGAIRNVLRLLVKRLVEANKHIYGRRWLLEAAFKTIKRLFGCEVRSLSRRMAAIETAFKAVCYNLYRLCLYLGLL